MSINVNKFPINTISDEQVNGIGNLNVSVTTSKSGVIQTILSTPCTSATSSFKIQISFTTYSAWANGGIIIGHTGSTTDNNDMRVFFTSTDLYYDFNSARKYTSASSYFGKVNNWEIGNYYIKNLDNNTNILTGTTQSIGTHLNYLGMWGASDSCILHWLKIWQNGSTLTYDIIPFKDSQGYGLYDQVSHTMKYRVTNNNQVQFIGSTYQTQVKSLYWLDTMVNKAYMGNNLIFEKTISYYDTQYFCIEAVENCDVTFSPANSMQMLWIASERRLSQVDIAEMFEEAAYSVLNAGTSSTSSFITLPPGTYLYMFGNNEKIANSSKSHIFVFSGKVNLSGNIMSLTHGLDEHTYDLVSAAALPNKNFNGSNTYQMARLFKDQPVVNARNLSLTSQTLGDYNYLEMFRGCTYLTAAPAELPALTVKANAYNTMFQDCTSLMSAPVIKATSINGYSFRTMFRNCTALTQVSDLQVVEMSGGSCCYQMFYGCTSLTTAPTLPSTTVAPSCYRGMFYGCTSLTTAPALPATTLASSCYNSMFYGCTSLETAPALPATTLASQCYYQMFYNCINLTSIPSRLPATTLASQCYAQMFKGCTSLTTPPALPATTLASTCYNQMFYGCYSLIGAPVLLATTLASQCYYQMFYDCYSLTSAPTLPATTLQSGCYTGMFRGCINLTSAPVLRATDLISNCYAQMFYGCTKLNYIKALFTTDPSGLNYLTDWVNGVSATGTFVKNSSATWNVTGNNGVPSGWTVQTASS